MKTLLIKQHIPGQALPVKYLRGDGTCPFCNCKIRIEEQEGFIYKIRLFKIFRSGLKQVKCPKCKETLSER